MKPITCVQTPHMSAAAGTRTFQCYLIQAALYITSKSCSFPSLPSPTIFYNHPHSSIPEALCRVPFGIKFEKSASMCVYTYRHTKSIYIYI